MDGKKRGVFNHLDFTKKLYLLQLFTLLITMCQCSNNASMDLVTPRNAYLTAFYKRSFAYYTVKVRMPVILTQTIDSLVRSKEEIGKVYGPEAQEELKVVIGEISKLKYEIQTNKPLELLRSNAPDVKIYNDYLTKLSDEEGHTTYFHTIWLVSECYMYRRLREIFELTNHLQSFDPFRNQKIEAYNKSLASMEQVGQHLYDVLNKQDVDPKKEFITLLKVNLWGNKLDLSLSLGQVDSNSSKYLFDINRLDQDILADDSERVWDTISTSSGSGIIDIVFDNAGYEVFTDLCLADFLVTNKYAQKIRLYVKTIPWFISDVMTYDLNWVLQQMKNEKNETLRTLASRWQNYILNEVWTIEEHGFWTLPMDFSVMSSVDPELYKKLAQAKLVIFKGDLNYRKLFGERNWDPETPTCKALQGFHPSKICSLRTLKADIICGLGKGVAEATEAKDKDWMETGKYGVIQFCDKINAIE